MRQWRVYTPQFVRKSAQLIENEKVVMCFFGEPVRKSAQVHENKGAIFVLFLKEFAKFPK
jgi:hypothetical protein